MHETTARTISSPVLFKALSAQIREVLLKTAILRRFADGQIIQNRGDIANGFWVIQSGQIKMGRFDEDGEMRVVVIFGPGDSFGELACLGGFGRVVDAVAIGETKMFWISEASFVDALGKSPEAMRHVLGIFSRQLQEALDNLVAVRKMPAKRQLARVLLALCEGRQPPVTLSIRHNELAELIGVTRMTIGTVLGNLEELGHIKRGYRNIMVSDPIALRNWMRRV